MLHHVSFNARRPAHVGRVLAEMLGADHLATLDDKLRQIERTLSGR